MSKNNSHVDPDDFFSDTRMSFGEHIEDLRTHLIRAIKGFLIALVFAFFIAKPVLRFIAAPVERQLQAYWNRFYEEKQKEIMAGMESGAIPNNASATLVQRYWKEDLENALGLPKLRQDVAKARGQVDEELQQGPAFNPIPAFEKVLDKLGVASLVESVELENTGWIVLRMQMASPQKAAAEMHKYLKQIQPPALTTLSAQEAFVVFVKVALATGFVLGSPWIFYQIWMFIAAGLYPQEKKYIHLFLPFSIILFLGGVLLCEFFVMDKALEALLWFNDFLGMAPDLRLSEWLGFAVFMPLIFGISFQTPIVMLALQRVGIVTVEGFRKHWRMTWFLMAVFAAVITPSTDPVSMLLLWVPMVLLFELGIWLCRYLPGRPLIELDMPEPEEMVEV